MKKLISSLLLISFVWGCKEIDNIVKKPKYDDHDSSADFALKGRKWDKNNLTYYLESSNGAMNSQTVRQAFNIWQQNTNLTFTEVSQRDKAYFKLSFEKDDHNDGRPFDGQGGILAHGFFPPPTKNAGLIHFDSEEQWTSNTNNSDQQPIDLVIVAAHEIGHALGLNHSENSSALMFADYVGSHQFLDQDDKSGICAIYGCTPNNGGGNNSTIPTNGLVAYYPFNGNTQDLSGNNNNGTGKGSISYVTAVRGTGLKLRGITNPEYVNNPDYVFVPNSPSLQFSNAFTVSYWVRIDGNTSQTWADCSGNIVSGIGGTVVAKDGDRNGWYFNEWEKSTSLGIIAWNNGTGVSAENIATVYQNLVVVKNV